MTEKEQDIANEAKAYSRLIVKVTIAILYVIAVAGIVIYFNWS
jgi:flagellar basal body-associated protein FliL